MMIYDSSVIIPQFKNCAKNKCMTVILTPLEIPYKHTIPARR